MHVSLIPEPSTPVSDAVAGTLAKGGKPRGRLAAFFRRVKNTLNLKRRWRHAKAKKRQNEATIRRLEKEVIRLTDADAAADKTIKEALDGKKKEIDDLRGENDSLKTEMGGLKTQIADQETKTTTLMAQLCDAQNDILTATDKANEAAAAVTKAEESAKKDIEEMKQKVDEADQKAVKAIADAEAAQKYATDVKAKAEKANNEAEEAKTAAANVDKKLNENVGISTAHNVQPDGTVDPSTTGFVAGTAVRRCSTSNDGGSSNDPKSP